MLKNVVLHSVATALANIVFPVPTSDEMNTCVRHVHCRYPDMPRYLLCIDVNCYRIAGKFGKEFNLAVWWVDMPTTKLESTKIKS